MSVNLKTTFERVVIPGNKKPFVLAAVELKKEHREPR